MMKRKAVAMLLALTVMSTMVACGGKKEEQTSANIKKQVAQEQEAEPVEEEVIEEESDSDDISTWTAYEGVLDDGGVIFYCYNTDATRGAFIYLSEDETKSVTIMGDYGYDEKGNLARFEVSDSGSPLLNMQYSYDEFNRPSAVTSSAMAGSPVQSYSYDTLGRTQSILSTNNSTNSQNKITSSNLPAKSRGYCLFVI